MSDIVIKSELLSKRYRIGLAEKQHDTMIGAAIGMVSRPANNLKSLWKLSSFGEKDQDSEDVIWALKDISFEITKNEIVGLIGPNGSGKSTLLKILSGITEPSSGRALINGRVASLLEVGTGFHPELTGRENVFLNGTALGMSAKEVTRKFEEIVDFSGVETYINTPVKRYSTGMKVRLAFAVAAHLEPEILLVDEVLAVGDAAFQDKCLGKISEISQEGRTIIFVSHNMGSIQRLCSVAYLLDHGKIVNSGNTNDVVDSYYKTMAASRDKDSGDQRESTTKMKFVDWDVNSSTEQADNHSQFTREPCNLRFGLEVREPIRQVFFVVTLRSSDGSLVWATESRDQDGGFVDLTPGGYDLHFRLPELPLRPGNYRFHISGGAVRDRYDEWFAAPEFVVLPKNETGLPRSNWGILNLNAKFDVAEKGKTIPDAAQADD